MNIPAELLSCLPRFTGRTPKIDPAFVVPFRLVGGKVRWEWYPLAARTEADGEIVFYGFVKGAEKEYGPFTLSELKELDARLESKPDGIFWGYAPKRLDRIDWDLNAESKALKRRVYPESIGAGPNGEDLVETRLSKNPRFAETHKVLLNRVGIGFVVQQQGRFLYGNSDKARLTSKFRGKYADTFEAAVQAVVADRREYLRELALEERNGHVRAVHGILLTNVSLP